MTKTTFSTSLWFDNQAEEALRFYTSIFPNSSWVTSNPIVASTNLSNISFIGINGGPAFKKNPSISMMVICETKEEVNQIWNKLIVDGHILMPLDSYPWSDHYGWIMDRYDTNWQLYLGKLSDVSNQKIVPTMMFCGSQQGKCDEALKFYETVFDDFESYGILRYQEGEMASQVQHSQFKTKDFVFMAMDSGVPQDFTFNEGVSFVINCANQEEIDYYWNSFTKNGKESMCGWCTDPFGVSWQIVPYNIDELLTTSSANAALMKMKKIVIADLV